MKNKWVVMKVLGGWFGDAKHKGVSEGGVIAWELNALTKRLLRRYLVKGIYNIGTVNSKPYQAEFLRLVDSYSYPQDIVDELGEVA